MKYHAMEGPVIYEDGRYRTLCGQMKSLIHFASELNNCDCGVCFRMIDSQQEIMIRNVLFATRY